MRHIGFASFVLTVWLSLFAGQSQAGLLPVNVTISADDVNHRYSYGVVLTSDSILRTGDYFTVYDFAGLQEGSNMEPEGFTFSSNLVGTTPAGTLPVDDPATSNVTWTYTGPDTVVGQTGLGNFMVVSTYDTTTEGVFAAFSHREIDGQPDANITEADVPVPVATEVPQVPEPASFALIAIGLSLAFSVNLYRRRFAC